MLDVLNDYESEGHHGHREGHHGLGEAEEGHGGSEGHDGILIVSKQCRVSLLVYDKITT